MVCELQLFGLESESDNCPNASLIILPAYSVNLQLRFICPDRMAIRIQQVVIIIFCDEKKALERGIIQIRMK